MPANPFEHREAQILQTPENKLDIEFDPKIQARQIIIDFLSITTEDIMNKPADITPMDELVPFGMESDRPLNPNRRLAAAMLGLNQAVSALRQAEPPVEHGEEVRSDWTEFDGVTGKMTTLRFYATKAGSDFGTILQCRINPDIDIEPTDGSYLHVLLPSDRYLRDTIHYGDPREPVFWASEPDVYSPDYSSEREEWLENGGKAVRRHEMIDYFYSDENGQKRADFLNVYLPDRVEYGTLYDKYSQDDAIGADKYIGITQKLLNMFLRAVDERDGESLSSNS